jgi:hypothetical protein
MEINIWYKIQSDVALDNNKNIISDGTYNFDTSVAYIHSSNIYTGLQYSGDINSELKSMNLGKTTKGNYIYGSVVVVEWVNGIPMVPNVKPKMILKATDESFSKELYVTPTGTNTYYFDGYIDGLDNQKSYKIEIVSGNVLNISANKTQNLRTTTTKDLGTINGTNASYRSVNGELQMAIYNPNSQYSGDINSELKSMNLGKTTKGNYIYGSVVVVEWVNGIPMVPNVKPKMILKATDESFSKELYVTPTGTNTYYFDGYIDGLDNQKSYKIENS